MKNPHSSRGHTVYFAKIKMKELEDVYFIAVDLAGSEGQTVCNKYSDINVLYLYALILINRHWVLKMNLLKV